MKVLIVDDDPFLIALLERQLGHLGACHVQGCTRAEDALVAIAEADTPFDVLFCDLNMPELDGVQFIRSLASVGYGGAVALLSGEDQRILQAAERLAKARGLRLVGTLEKPASLDHLRHVLDMASPGPGARHPLPHTLTFTADDVRTAIVEQQLVVHYQPQVELATGALVGVEALVRWDHPHHGLLLPGSFIGVAEAHGLIGDLTIHVLTAALSCARMWLDAGLDLRVSVNVTLDSLVMLDFPDMVSRAADQAGVPTDRLVLEVTERNLTEDAESLLDITTRLRLKKLGLSIDDFGTGHASLSQLRELPFDELKMARDFVRNICRDESVRAIFETNLSMSHRLGLRVVAEGVADADEWHYIRAAGCDVAQSFFIGEPMPGRDLSTWLSGWRLRLGELVPS